MLEHHQLGAGGVDQMLEEVAAVVGVDRRVERAELVQGEPRQDELEPIAHHDRDTIAAGYPQRRQTSGQAVAELIGLRVRDGCVIDGEGQERLVLKLTGALSQQLRKHPTATVLDDQLHVSLSSGLFCFDPGLGLYDQPIGRILLRRRRRGQPLRVRRASAHAAHLAHTRPHIWCTWVAYPINTGPHPKQMDLTENQPNERLTPAIPDGMNPIGRRAEGGRVVPY